jgi:hypothetical protein
MWDYTTQMKTIKKDSLYELTTTSWDVTLPRIKFMVNGLEFENEEKPKGRFSQRPALFL